MLINAHGYLTCTGNCMFEQNVHSTKINKNASISLMYTSTFILLLILLKAQGNMGLKLLFCKCLLHTGHCFSLRIKS